jgi:hydrogenase maturation protease
MSQKAPVLILAYGNLSRGDDAVGPLLAARLEAWLAEISEERIEVLSDFQLNIEHVLDLVDRRRVLLIDARIGGSSRFSCEAVSPAADARFSTHQLSPGGLLEVYRRLRWVDPPPLELLSIPARSFELGEPVHPATAEQMEEAWSFLKDWCSAALAEELDEEDGESRRA